MTEESVRNSSSCKEAVLLVNALGMFDSVSGRAYSADRPQCTVCQGDVPFGGHFATSG